MAQITRLFNIIEIILLKIGVLTEARGKSVFRINRAQTKPAVEVFLLLLGVSLVSGVAYSLDGLPSQILPGPEGDVTMVQMGNELSITIDYVEENVGNVSVQVTSKNDTRTTGGVYYFNNVSSHEDVFEDTTSSDGVGAGDTLRINVSTNDIVTVTAKADDSAQENKIATKQMGPIN